MLHIAICDDETEYLEQTSALLNEWSVQAAVPVTLHCFPHGDALIAGCKTQKYDIVFMDILMPMLNGLNTARELREHDKNVQIVFLTSTPDFALESYSIKAADYCIKPITYDRLKEIMDYFLRMRYQEPKHLIVKTADGYCKIYFHEIEYIEAQNKHCCFFLADGTIQEVIQPLHTLEAQLVNDSGFYKCHRSYLVYIPHIAHFTSKEITTKFGRLIPIARSYSKEFHDMYFSFMFQKEWR